MNDHWNSDTRPQKAEARLLALPKSQKSKTIWLPGNDCLCVREAKAKKLLAPRGQHIFVERIPETAIKVQEYIDKEKWVCKPVLHIGGLLELKAPTINYAFFDFKGGIEKEVADWLHNLDLLDGAELSFTFAYGWRGNKFMYSCQELFSSLKYQFDLSADLKISDGVILLYIAIIKSLLNNYDFKVMRPIYYRDSVSMVLYRFREFTKRNSPRPCYIEPLIGGTTMTTEAAKKAWKTRRKKAAI
jgi:hypothetical protein